MSTCQFISSDRHVLSLSAGDGLKLGCFSLFFCRRYSCLGEAAFIMRCEKCKGSPGWPTILADNSQSAEMRISPPRQFGFLYHLPAGFLCHLPAGFLLLFQFEFLYYLPAAFLFLVSLISFGWISSLLWIWMCQRSSSWISPFLWIWISPRSSNWISSILWIWISLLSSIQLEF